MATEDPEEQPQEEPEFEAGINLALHCVLNNMAVRFAQFFDNEDDPYHECIAEHVIQRDNEGKSPLDMAATLGRTEMTRELLARGSEVNQCLSQGYTPLHRASAWGRVDVLKVLIENGADLQLKTIHGERPREIALRYNQAECVDYLDWSEAKIALRESIKLMQETLADPEKVQGKLTKDEKNISTNACREKNDWVDNTPDATTQDFILKKEELEETLAPIWQKINEPLPEKPGKN